MTIVRWLLRPFSRACWPYSPNIDLPGDAMASFNLIPHFILERLSAGERHGRFAAAALADHFLI